MRLTIGERKKRRRERQEEKNTGKGAKENIRKISKGKQINEAEYKRKKEEQERKAEI